MSDCKISLQLGSASEVEMDKLCKYIYTKDITDRLRTRAILCHIYHHALHDRWFQARDLMLMSHLQDNIQHSDVPTQVGNASLVGNFRVFNGFKGISDLLYYRITLEMALCDRGN